MKKVYKSLRHSFLDGTFFSIMFGFGDTYFNPFAIFLKATNFQIGLLSSLPGLISSLAQIKTPEWTEKIGRSRIMCSSIFIQALIWIPIILIPFIFKVNSVWWLIFLVTIYSLTGSIAVPAWSSIMSQYLPPSKRGHYFAWRNKIHGAIALASTFLAGLILYLFPRESVYGFTVIFSIAALSRFLSWHNLTKMHEPRLISKPGSCFTLWDFLARTKESNFVKFVLFVAAMNFSVSLASPFFSVYMLSELKFDYLSFVIINITVTLSMLLTLSSWGKHTDKMGSVSVIRLTSLILPIIPMLWLVSSSKPYLVFIQAISGFAWGGFNLAVSNFIFDAVSEEKRVRCISYFNLLSGIGIFLGAAMGGFLVSVIPHIEGSRLLTIFLLSGIFRIFVRIFLLPKIREVKKVTNISSLDLFFSVTGVKPTNLPE